ncbi:alpha/beta hydrolase family protein [Pseudothermotoga sp.]|nr:alpha/beta hydrolase [Pseudothermotoga sp.]MDW8140583.1 alpha/beta hydrolase [Pseudothermotoga sp.]
MSRSSVVRKKFSNRIRIWLKLSLIIFSLSLNFFVFLLVVLIFNIPYLRRAVFGRLPFKVNKKPWLCVKTFEYMKGLKLDVFYPRSQKRGVVLFAHGGGWISGYRRQPNNLSWYKFLVSRGFIVAAVDYSRGYRAKIDDLVDELSQALKFLKSNREKLGLPDGKISLMGLSAGGHLALLTATKMYWLVKNVVAYYAPSDLLDVWESPSLFARISLIATLKRLPVKSKEVYAEYSPINRVHPSMPPVLLVHGKKDSIVPYESSVKMYRKLKKLGCKVKLLTHPTAEHGFEFVLKDEKTRQIVEATVEFLSEGGPS